MSNMRYVAYVEYNALYLVCSVSCVVEVHSLAGSSTSHTFLGFTAAASGTFPPQQGAAKPFSPPPPPPEKHKTSSYALHRARVPMKTYDYLNVALRRCLVPFFDDTLAPPARINTTNRFYFSL